MTEFVYFFIPLVPLGLMVAVVIHMIDNTIDALCSPAPRRNRNVH